MWDPIPVKYNVKCMINDSNTVKFERVYEALNKEEAESRGLLNCIRENNKKTNVHVEVKKLF